MKRRVGDFNAAAGATEAAAGATVANSAAAGAAGATEASNLAGPRQHSMGVCNRAVVRREAANGVGEGSGSGGGRVQ